MGKPAEANYISEDWEPSSELIEWAKAQRPQLNIEYIIESFKDYWMSESGVRAKKRNWNATFRNWVRTTRIQPGINTGNNNADDDWVG